MISPVQTQLTEAQLLPASVDNQISTAVASKTLDAARQQGAAVLQLLDSAANAGLPAGDPLTAKATGLGGQLDITG